MTSELKGKWIKIPGADAQSGGLTQVGDLAGLLDKNIAELKSSKSHLTKTGETTINGKKVVGLTGTANGQKGTIFVEAAEPHYPVALEASEASGGNAKATFEDWNANAEVKAPANAVDLQSLLGNACKGGRRAGARPDSRQETGSARDMLVPNRMRQRTIYSPRPREACPAPDHGSRERSRASRSPWPARVAARLRERPRALRRSPAANHRRSPPR